MLKMEANTLEWKNRVSIFRNSLILKQLGIAIGIPFGILIIILFVLRGDLRYKIYGIGLIAALFVCTWLFVIIVYRRPYGGHGAFLYPRELFEGIFNGRGKNRTLLLAFCREEISCLMRGKLEKCIILSGWDSLPYLLPQY